MTDCPLCECQFIQGYEHTQYQILICAACYRIVKQVKQHRSYAVFSPLGKSIKKRQKEANTKLKEFRKQREDGVRRLLETRIVECCFQPVVEIEKSDRTSITTEDTDVFGDILSKTQKGATRVALDKCKEKVTALASRMEPTKQMIEHSKEAFLQKTENVKEAYRNLRSQFRTIKAELPPMGTLANQAKQKLNRFFKFF